MTAVQQKILHDVWHERARTIGVVLAIALGIAGFTTVLSAYAILTRELQQSYLATNPPSATLHAEGIDDAAVTAVIASGLVAEAEPRRSVFAHVKSGPIEWRNLTLFVIRDFSNISVSKLKWEQGKWPPKSREMLIERDALQVAHAKIGDTANVKFVGQAPQSLRIVGSVHDVGLPQARMENTVYGYITRDTLASLGQDAGFNELRIVVEGDRFDEKHIRTVSAQVKTLLANRGHRVSRIDVPPPGKHPHADIMELLLLSMAAFGFAIFLLSGILVINLLAAQMTAHVRHIGTMKAIGASRFQICSIYFAEVALLGMAAIVIALPLGIGVGRLLCNYLAALLNLDITTFSLPGWEYLLVFVVGLGVPLAAAAVPIIKGSAITVREAMSDFGVNVESFSTPWPDWVLAAMGTRFRPLLMVMRNMLRKRNRFVLTVAALAASGTVFICAVTVRASLVQTIDRTFASRTYDLGVRFDTLYPMAQMQQSMRGISGIARAEGWIVTEASFPIPGNQSEPDPLGGRAPSEGRADGYFNLTALPAGTDLHMDILAGRSLTPSDSDGIVVNSSLLARRPDLKVGAIIELRTGAAITKWHVVGIAREAFASAAAYASARGLTFLGDTDGMANSLRITLNQPTVSALKAVKAALDQNFERDGLRTMGSATKAEARYSLDQHMLMIYEFLIISSVLIAMVGGLGLFTSTTLNVLERRREIGILRAIGATPRTVTLIIVAESILAGLVSWALALVAAWFLSEALGNWLIAPLFQARLDVRYEPLGLLLWLIFSVLISIAASLLPAVRASRASIHGALVAT